LFSRQKLYKIEIMLATVGRVSGSATPMSKTGVLGSFEELVLLALLHQGNDAYSVTIRREIEQRSSSQVSMGAVYATLDRLEDKGLIRSRAGDTGPARRGRPRRYYELAPDGAAALARTRHIRETMWSGIELPLHDKGTLA
jgi:DNA-binding PadR family transcriptional regulator